MQNAQIWRSIEALSDEAEMVAQSGAPMMAVVKSTPPPKGARPRDDAPPKSADGAHAVVMLQARPAPPQAILETHRTDKPAGADDAERGLTPATMADIAAAIEQVSKIPRPQPAADNDQSMRDDIRQQMIGEISEAVRMVLANELPKMVRHAVSASLYELITTTAPDQTLGQTPGQRLDQMPSGDNLAKPAPKTVSRKKAAKKKTGTPKTIAKKPATAAKTKKAVKKMAATARKAPKKAKTRATK